MATPVQFSSRTFARLQALAVPLVDDIETVVTRLLDFYEAKNGAVTAPLSQTPALQATSIRLFHAAMPPSLTHTKVLSANLCGEEVSHDSLTWNGLLHATIR